MALLVELLVELLVGLPVGVPVELLVAHERLQEMPTGNCVHHVHISHCRYETAERVRDFAHKVHMLRRNCWPCFLCVLDVCRLRIERCSKDNNEGLESLGVPEVE